MGIKQTIRRLTSVRGPSSALRRRRNSDLDAAAPITGGLLEQSSTLVEEDPTAGRPSTTIAAPSQEGEADEQRSYQLVLGAETTNTTTATSQAPGLLRGPTGKRKPSNAARLRQIRQQEERQNDGDPRPRRRVKLHRDEEPPPQDYLYFGEGPSSCPRSHAGADTTPSIQITPAAGAGIFSGAGGARSNPRTSGNAATGRLTVPMAVIRENDASGFQSAGIVTQNMGYQNLTYGGALQFDYANAQAPGTGATYPEC